MTPTPRLVQSHGFAEDLSRLRFTAEAFHVEPGYWHTEVFLKTPEGIVAFESLEHSIAPYFDVYSLRVIPWRPAPITWSPLHEPLEIVRAYSLWRDEWLEPSQTVNTSLVGGAPRFDQFARPVGAAPSDAVASARVLAGVLLESDTGGQLAIYASASAPLNVEIATSRPQIAQALALHSYAAAG